MKSVSCSRESGQPDKRLRVGCMCRCEQQTLRPLPLLRDVLPKVGGAVYLHVNDTEQTSVSFRSVTGKSI